MRSTSGAGKGQGPPSSRKKEEKTAAGEQIPEIDRSGSVAIGLRLAIGKDGLGIELATATTLASGPIDVVELVVRLPHVRFPFDVTGGITKFRHRRGELERIAIELDSRRVARFAEPHLRGLLDTGPCVVSIAPRAFGATVTVLAAVAQRALAFELAVLATGTDLVLVVHGARGANLPAPATLLAMRAVSTLLGEHAKREGARFVIPRAAERLARVLLPDAGVRAPEALEVVLSGSGESDGILFLAFARGAAAAVFPPAATLANEEALLARAADDARFAGDLERARHLDLSALEQAPRHPQIARRIAEIDAHVGGRAEAAVATLKASERSPYLGRLLGDLLHEMGDSVGAIAALLREGERDPSPAVAALSLARAAELASSPTDALSWLDSAIARAPSLAELRWERAARRLAQGRLTDARADFQELEALARGSRARFEVLRRAADVHRTKGLGGDAATLYERALLYRPDDPDTMAGLGVAIASEGRATRGAALLARAIEIAETRVPRHPTSWMDLELARVLAERLNDRPAAVARLRAVADDAPEAIEARGLEGRYRAALGDAAGASLAYARLRERAGREVKALPWLSEAAKFEEGRGELSLAQAHYAAALAIDPSSVELEAKYRAVSDRVGRAAGLRAGIDPLAQTGDLNVSIAVKPEPARDRVTLAAPPEGAEARSRETLSAPEEIVSVENDEARVESLTQMLQGDPTNDAVVDELVVRLTRLGRSMELLALLSARLEDAPPDRRAELLPRHREVLLHLENEARGAGREGEADLFKMAREASEL